MKTLKKNKGNKYIKNDIAGLFVIYKMLKKVVGFVKNFKNNLISELLNVRRH